MAADSQDFKNPASADTYINANFVHSPLGLDRKIIAAQGPKSNSVDHFWRMVLEQNVTMIVSVCRLAEGGRPKCHKYWPQGESTSDPEFEGLLKKGYNVVLKEEGDMGPTLQRKVIEVSKEGGKKVNVT